MGAIGIMFGQQEKSFGFSSVPFIAL